MLKLEQLLNDVHHKRPLLLEEAPYVLGPVDCALALIGDVHGAKGWYEHTCARAEYSIQLGDINNSPHLREYFDDLDPNRHKYIHGNHDWLNGLPAPNYLGLYGTWTIDEYDLKIGFISGAFSVDRRSRLQSNYDPVHDNEELAYFELESAIELMHEEQPDVIVSHTAPYFALEHLKLIPHFGPIKSRTNIALDRVFEECRPTLWAFGHFHQDKYFYYPKNRPKTTFLCVNQQTFVPFLKE